MSQGDYIRYKKVAQVLKMQSKLPPVIESGQYTNYKEFSIENTVVNDLTQYDRVLPNNMRVVFGMERPKATTCPTFEVCVNTNLRTNRALDTYNALQTIPMNAQGKKKQGLMVFTNAHCKCV
jgi:hypothetical protein